MKIEEFKSGIDIYLSNEEKQVLENIVDGSSLETYTERHRFVIENLIRKDLVTKFKRNNINYLVRND
jgi:hypothetical protein